MIALAIVDASPALVHVPAQQQLLVVAIDDEGYKDRCCKETSHANSRTTGNIIA